MTYTVLSGTLNSIIPYHTITAGNANSSGKEDAQQDHNIRDGTTKVVSLYEAQKFKGSIDFVGTLGYKSFYACVKLYFGIKFQIFC